MKIIGQQAVTQSLTQRLHALHTYDEWQHGQGLVEFAMILVLVGVVAILGLKLMGDGVRGTLCAASSSLGADTSLIEGCDYVEITRLDCSARKGVLQVWAQYHGDAEDVELVMQPGGSMKLTHAKQKRFYIRKTGMQCPVSVTVRASNGYSATSE